MLSLQTFCIVTGAAVLISNVFIHIFKREINPATSEYTSVWEVTKLFKGFIVNRNLRFIVLLTLTWKLGLAPVEATAGVKLIQNGYSKDTLTNMSTILIPLQFINSIIVGRSSREKKDMSVWVRCLWYRLFQNIFVFGIVYFVDINSYWLLATVLIFISSINDTFIGNGMFVAQSAFANRICDPAVGGTFMTTIAALSNFGRSVPDSFALYVENYISWEVVAICGWIYTLFYLLRYGKQIRELETKDKSEFSVVSVRNIKKPTYIELENQDN